MRQFQVLDREIWITAVTVLAGRQTRQSHESNGSASRLKASIHRDRSLRLSKLPQLSTASGASSTAVSTRKLDRVMSTYRKDDHYLGLSADDYREIESNLEALEGLVNDNVLNQSSWNESGRCG